MNTFFIASIVCFSGTNLDVYQHESLHNIPIYVGNTWQIPYATDIQDICFNWQYLVIRSNSDGKLYLADPDDCSYQGEIPVPAAMDGFGVAFLQDGPAAYCINSSSTPEIGMYDGSDTWAYFPNPAGTGGAGMNFDWSGGPELFEVSSASPYQFYGIEPDGTGFNTYALPGISDEISGFMPHGVMTAGGYPPGACIATTRLGHEFFFYHESSGGMTLYGQEPCPFPVLQSLGLAWKQDLSVFWSYQGLDSLYYVAELYIPVFGGIEDESGALSDRNAFLDIVTNPASGSATIKVNMPNPGIAALDVYDVSGRIVETVLSGQISSGMNSFSFQGSPGIYIAVLRNTGQEHSLKFILTK